MKIDILYDVPVRLGEASALESELGTLSFKSDYKTIQIPILIGDFHSGLRDRINLFLLHKASDNHKDLSSMAKAFKTWVKWLVDEKIDPFSVPKFKFKSPTYGFRQHLIERVTENHNLKTSTANSYMLVIKAFYETLYEDGILDKSHFYHHKTSIINGYRKLQSSDLAIRVRRSVDGNLNPLNREVQLNALKLLKNQNKNFQLVFKLMILCGLRLSEALSFPCKLLREELFPNDGSKLIRGVTIGPAHGVQTKFDTDRELFITVILANEILDHEFSIDYIKNKTNYLEKRKEKSKHIPLFIGKSYNNYSKEAFYSSWVRFKNSYQEMFNEKFDHRPHDLRATFATNLLKVALYSFPNNIDTCIETTRIYMGHRNTDTTLKYIKFLNRKKTANDVAEVVDKYILEVFKEIV
ncbi:tyrosine-type recombinase/integrase [Vibrio campbellii]|uniref:tyrosine-type recombinase/integrase n=1 Tax=Vibrio campbellii TaxID=680 RepID=UPI000CD34088|nr:site-specific integrase [Vibrio campbellii]AUW04410.1 hypothetical protein C1N51_12180 [Vibrio campbellii]